MSESGGTQTQVAEAAQSRGNRRPQQRGRGRRGRGNRARNPQGRETENSASNVATETAPEENTANEAAASASAAPSRETSRPPRGGGRGRGRGRGGGGGGGRGRGRGRGPNRDAGTTAVGSDRLNAAARGGAAVFGTQRTFGGHLTSETPDQAESSFSRGLSADAPEFVPGQPVAQKPYVFFLPM